MTIEAILSEHAALEKQLADPNVIADNTRYTQISKRYSQLSETARVASALQTTRKQLQQARALAGDPELGELAKLEVQELETSLTELETKFEDLIAPRDEADERNVIVEVRAGVGGQEAALFAADLYRMYQKYADQQGFKFETIDTSESELGGFSKITFEITGTGVYGKFKFESGPHRVQRVPATEAAGRIHTSTATVAVMPEAEDVDVNINQSDVRVDVFRSGGHGGQGVNTTDSAVRLVYKSGTPEEMIVTCQDGRSQLKNKEKAMAVLRARIFEKQRAESSEKIRQSRLAQIGTGERAEKIRTYNYPQNRVTDHRLEGENKNHQLDEVMLGALSPLVLALAVLERQELAAQQSAEFSATNQIAKVGA